MARYDNALKNVRSAALEGIPTATYVDRVATRFAAVQTALCLSFDDFIRTSSDPRHRPGPIFPRLTIDEA
jgi:methionyl-tRNA synthetase